MNDHFNSVNRLRAIYLVFGILFLGFLFSLFDTSLGQNTSQIVLPLSKNVLNSSTTSVPITNYRISDEFQALSNNFSSSAESKKIPVSDAYVEPFISNSTLFKGNLLLEGQKNEPIENHTILTPTFSN